MSPRPELRPVGPGQQGPAEARLTPGAERIRDRVSEHQDPKAWLDLHHPQALDLCAAALDELHDELHGIAAGLAEPRPEKYFREQLRGEHPLTVLDLCRLATTAPRGVVRFLTVVARACGYDLVPQRVKAPDIREATARVAETQGHLVATVTRAAADGEIDAEEDREIDAAIRQTEDRLAELKAAKGRGR